MGIVICIILICVLMVGFILVRKRNKPLEIDENVQNHALSDPGTSNALSVRFEELPVNTFVNETKLVEIKNKDVVNRIINDIPGLVVNSINVDTAKNVADIEKNSGIYQVIIPEGKELVNSKSMPGAKRAFYRQDGKIGGNANLKSVDDEVNKLKNMANVNAVFDVASMVVGQYYMSQISSELRDIHEEISSIGEFQENEYKSKIYALVAQTQKISTFQMEILESDEQRQREISKLQDLEHECIELLGQANLSLTTVVKDINLDYHQYENKTKEADLWYQFQQVLLEILIKVGELNYTLNLGSVSQEKCFAVQNLYIKQTMDTLDKLDEWHNILSEKHGISLEYKSRKRKGMDAAIHWIPAMFNGKHRYRRVSDQVIDMIEAQSTGGESIEYANIDDLFHKDVKLLSKDGKIYYLPNDEES